MGGGTQGGKHGIKNHRIIGEFQFDSRIVTDQVSFFACTEYNYKERADDRKLYQGWF
jgi:hypothetical protein